MAGPWHTIVDADTLHAHLGDAQLVLLDCRFDYEDPEAGRRAYDGGHLPGALFVDLNRDLSSREGKGTGRHPLPDPDDFRDTCSRWGIGPGVQVVAYDDVGGQYAARAWWLLRDYGHVATAVLDGGIHAWTRAGYALTTDVPSPAPAAFKGTAGHMRTVASWDLVTRMPRRLVDARDAYRYRGESDPHDPVAGHVPGAVNAPTEGNLDEGGRFLPPDVLRERFKALVGDLPARDVAVYCGSGITAPHDILALEIAGLPGAALYPGSWSEWIRKPYHAVATGDEGAIAGEGRDITGDSAG